MTCETAFNMSSSNIRYGLDATREIGMDLADMGVNNVMVLTDSNLAKLPPVFTVLESLDDQKLKYTLFDRVRIEPTDESFLEAIAFAESQTFDHFLVILHPQRAKSTVGIRAHEFLALHRPCPWGNPFGTQLMSLPFWVFLVPISPKLTLRLTLRGYDNHY